MKWQPKQVLINHNTLRHDIYINDTICFSYFLYVKELHTHDTYLDKHIDINCNSSLPSSHII